MRSPFQRTVCGVLWAAVAALAPVIAPYDPNALVASPLEDPSSTHLLGTDPLGRDVLSRIIHATRVDLPLAVVVVVLSAAVGTVAGSIIVAKVITKKMYRPRQRSRAKA